MHPDSRAVIKVVRYGLNLACFPDEHAVELVERQIANQRERHENEELPLILSRLVGIFKLVIRH
jgi:hypothetical protein